MKIYEIPQNIKDANALEDKLKLLKTIGRSFSVFRIDCGSCNGCEIETFAAITPMWDPERFGFKLVANPRHADILLCSGPVTRQMYYPLLRAYEAVPDPKLVVALGACGSSGGIFYDCYSVLSGVDKIIPVDVYIPGCPPHPASIIYGLTSALGVMDQKLKKISFEKEEKMPLIVEDSVLDNILFERDLLVHAKRLMSYIFGRKLYDKYLQAIKDSKDPKDPKETKKSIIKAMQSEEDPRYAECLGILHNEVYVKYISCENEDKIELNNAFGAEKW
ncbi:NADH-quinone oxidoreductase subunit B family protein [Campylobacter sp. RM12327]|uniref:NADH-quinone oxidoreductase subunit B family protein n=1 Tax=Campylobacter sputorum TaxID=206 RepID=UPI00187ADF97|nr:MULTISPECIES: NADH-quinone oxidoreductase subunit B family protein [unclassified Campylobacter]MBE7358582.1 NADH-quinone oxidoreductase subunit B family protein [Campylobacter sp. RM11302]MBF6669947.1 NADH-quinone oxidoreductase subunit B family protein [Campylobacter sp. RM12327]MBF6675109.1 NADH-quinone oxidoreductase subunit B family protein [Campylobacter sp. RM13538]MBF6678271.1 NADH-quinone oxidoreductase subunit B family protein [Campylobacter sp. RM11259]